MKPYPLQELRRIKNFILKFQRQYGCKPLGKEIAEGCGMKYHTAVNYIDRLQEKGMLKLLYVEVKERP